MQAYIRAFIDMAQVQSIRRHAPISKKRYERLDIRALFGMKQDQRASLARRRRRRFHEHARLPLDHAVVTDLDRRGGDSAAGFKQLQCIRVYKGKNNGSYLFFKRREAA